MKNSQVTVRLLPKYVQFLKTTEIKEVKKGKIVDGEFVADMKCPRMVRCRYKPLRFMGAIFRVPSRNASGQLQHKGDQVVACRWYRAGQPKRTQARWPGAVSTSISYHSYHAP
eukprot:SAG31_NODE_5494_length_2502_cov_3.044944_1_plen_113_part_00